jgi:hypothetical protein
MWTDAFRFSLFAFRQKRELDGACANLPKPFKPSEINVQRGFPARSEKRRANGGNKKKPTRGAVYGGPSMNPHYTVGTRRSSLGISAWRNVAHRTEYESSSLFIEHWFKKR